MTTTTTTAHEPATQGRMHPLRRAALLTGVFFLVTYLTSIAAKFYFYAPLSAQDDYVLGAGPDDLLLWGALNEVVLVAANIAPPSSSSRSSNGRAKPSPSDSSPPASSSPSSSASASSAS